MKSLGERIKSLRNGGKLTQRQLAKIINISDSTLSKIESGFKSNVDKEIIMRIADYFDVSIDYLFGKTESPVIHDDEKEFVSRLSLDLSDEELAKRFAIEIEGRQLTADETKVAISVLRAMFRAKNS